MKSLTEALAMSLALAAAPQALAASPDEAALKTMVESVAALADRSEFEALERLFADEALIDYASLSGKPAALKSPQGLMTEWAQILPGFDRTRHALSAVQAKLAGENGEATARVVADHWVGGLQWTVYGDYAYAFARTDGVWKITKMTFSLRREEGTRDVFGLAAEAARRGPAPYIVRQQTRQAVLDFLEGLEQKDMAKVNGVWAEEAVQEMPYVPRDFPERVAGKEALIRQYASWPDVAEEADFTSALVFHPMADPEQIFVEYRGVTALRNGKTYDQRYGGLFHVENGKITLFREYFDPRIFAEAFGLGARLPR